MRTNLELQFEKDCVIDKPLNGLTIQGEKKRVKKGVINLVSLPQENYRDRVRMNLEDKCRILFCFYPKVQRTIKEMDDIQGQAINKTLDFRLKRGRVP